MIEYNNFQEAYCNIVNDVLNNGNTINVRNNLCKEIIPYGFTILNPRDRLLNLQGRKNITKYIFGELLWYLSGNDEVSFISKYSKMWAKLSDDGKTNNSAYGKYIFRNTKDNISQWEWVKQKLKSDKYSRQAIIHIKPVQTYESKDYVCTITLTFYIRDNKLNMITYMRSNDLLFGTTYDVFMFTFMQELMAAELNMDIGKYTHITNNMHYYVKDEDVLKNFTNQYNNETVKLSNIPSNFRTNDLPILLENEERYWSNKDFVKVEMLSDIGKQLLNMLKE